MDKLNINTFIFDCFGVVCSPPLSSWYRDKSLKHGFVDEKLPEILREFDLGNLSEDDIVEYFLKYEGINSTSEQIRAEIDSYLKLDDKLAGLILKLKNAGFKTVLLSNANASFFERKIYQEYPEFKNLFEEIVISSVVKMVKPDPKIYLYTLQKIKLPPEETMFIDDKKANADAAINLGMHGFVYTEIKTFLEHLKSSKII
jgi:putative hydrolase of the HAD superfamily